MPFPSPPWQLSAEMWLSVFAARGSGRHDRPGGLYKERAGLTLRTAGSRATFSGDVEAS